ncbi:DNA polymerase III subunit gamma/tau [Vagococcus jeotgali]|uniref:DNA polymerase III subunit gamma/tau n=1 Tax=Vagococcus jeotgali TaxID=3109030 RepID=UPI002DD9E698|nr:DNA polymerase III subunit gamma/tau [Vagococcus sp. B2T-5]
MSYQALYREWRSQTFDDLIGQGIVTQTLKNAIMQQKISHAYLFTGPRGTGKTSAAKIFSKAINCLNPVDGEPCNVCQNCIGITEGRINDVLEIDAASNNGVEEIRDIRDKVKYAPTQVPYKVYIIDEVHMLSTGAFNALLKTLEEPPAHVIFILATTEPHKIPATIISRTQRFDFKRISQHDIEGRLRYILEEKGMSFEEQALKLIARSAEGGMRDALSIMDQGISYSDGVLTFSDAIEVTGSLTNQMMDDYLLACSKGETEDALGIMNDLLTGGKESNRIIENLLVHCRDILMYQQAPNLVLEQLGHVTDIFKELSDTVKTEVLYQWISEFNSIQKDMRYTQQASVYLEVLTIKLSHEPRKNVKQTQVVEKGVSPSVEDAHVQQLTQRVVELEGIVEQLKATPTSSQSLNQQPKPKATQYKIPTELVYQVLDNATKEHLLNVKDVWVDLLQLLTVTQRAMLKACEPVAASENGLVVSFEYDILCQKASHDSELQTAVKSGLNRLIGYSPVFISVPREKWGELRQQFILQMDDTSEGTSDKEEEAKVEVDPVVDEAKKIFGSFTEVVED